MCICSAILTHATQPVGVWLLIDEKQQQLRNVPHVKILIAVKPYIHVQGTKLSPQIDKSKNCSIHCFVSFSLYYYKMRY